MNQIEKVARAKLIDELALTIDQFLTHQIERDTLACGLTQGELTELATGLAAIAAMPVQAEPVDLPDFIDLFRIIRKAGRSDRAKAQAVFDALTPLYAHPPVPQWQGIETAPMEGSSILVWRDDWDEPVMARWVCCYDFLTEAECDASGMDDEALARHDWFCADYANGCRLESDQSPTHWMTLQHTPAGGNDAE